LAAFVTQYRSFCAFTSLHLIDYAANLAERRQDEGFLKGGSGPEQSSKTASWVVLDGTDIGKD
jgi:hypothetical protein